MDPLTYVKDNVRAMIAIALVVILVAMSGTIFWLYETKATALANLEAAETKIGSILGINKQWKEAGDRQAAAIATLKKDGSDLQQKMDTLKVELKMARADRDRKVKELLALDVPKDCDGAINWAKQKGQEQGQGAWNDNAQ